MIRPEHPRRLRYTLGASPPTLYDGVSIETAGGSPFGREVRQRYSYDSWPNQNTFRIPLHREGCHPRSRLSGKRVIITGASSGIGIETAEALAEARAEITLAVRNPDAGEEVAARLRISTGNPEIHVRRLDLADLHSVRAFSSAWSGPLHILVNNAGIMANPEGYQNHLSWRPVESTVSSVRFPTPSPSVFKGAALGYI